MAKKRVRSKAILVRLENLETAPSGGSSGPVSATWGSISGTLSTQTDLNTQLNARQPLATVLTNTTASFTTILETKLNGISAGATVNSSDATLLDRGNHTSSQAISTITGLQTALDDKAPLANPTFTGTVTLPAGQAVNGVTLTTGGGTSNFLRADGTYAAPPGGSGGNSYFPAGW